MRRTVPGRVRAVTALLPLALGAGAAATAGPAVEDALAAGARTALQRADLGQVRVVADGRRLTASVPAGVDEAEVERLLAEVPGVSVVQTTVGFTDRAEARACRDLPRGLERAGDVAFAGGSSRPTADGVGTARAVASLLRACRPARVVVGGHTPAGADGGPALSLARARAVVALLRDAGVGRGRLEVRGYADQHARASGGRDDRVTVVLVEGSVPSGGPT